MVSGERLAARTREVAPGIALAILVTLVAIVLGEAQARVFDDFVPLEPLVLALLLGLAIRALVPLDARLIPGIGFASRQVLEFAIVLLGASLNLADLSDAGAQILVAVLVSVSVTLGVGIMLGRAAGLGTRLAILIAVGNAICGNSAIAAVAPTIRAKKQEVASAIALTAVLGVGVVLTLPALVPLFDLSDERYGVIGGLTVYAVPQVIAATLPVSAESGQVGSLVKLTRVLLLGPVVALFAWIYRDKEAGSDASSSSLSLSKLLPWFVLGFGIMALLRTTHVIPDDLGRTAKEVSSSLTAVAMAALGLSVDIRTVRATGPRVAMVVLALTVLLVTMSLTLVSVMDIG